ncbi:MAG TPA: hypothetical protein VM198_08590 [Longimicrobiales bacterium]|nr:hypothetical protein [Longimicrobiales bacterium]
MRRGAWVGLLMAGSLAACNNDEVLIVDDTQPAAPQALAASYYGGAVTVQWELGAGWDGETFRVYSRRVTDADYFLIADVTSCADGLCSYVDWNVVADQTYQYYVSAVSAGSGLETATASSVQVLVPTPTPPPVPDAPQVIALDGAAYFIWGADARGAPDFSHYRVYQDAGGTSYLLGETDSEGFLDLLAGNGDTYAYFVTSMDTDGHESAGSASASGTPRPDFTAEFMYDHFADPTQSGFFFQPEETTLAVGDGSVLGDVHFRFETDVSGWWLVPGTGTEVYDAGFTTALKCGVGADAGCTDVSVAPSSGYTAADVSLAVESSYVLRVIGADGLTHYGVIRVTHLGLDQNSDAIMIFDWAYQLQEGNRNLVSQPGT